MDDELTPGLPAGAAPLLPTAIVPPVTARADGAELVIDGIIGEAVTARGVREALQSISGPLTVAINSPGGYATEGFAIYNLLRAHAFPVTARVDGLAASAASYIAMAGSTLLMPRASLLMIHNSSGLTWGTKHDHRATAEALAKLDEIMLAIYAERSGKPPAEIAAMMDAETWMTADEAVAARFATALIADPPAGARALNPARQRAFAAFLSGFRSVPGPVFAMLSTHAAADRPRAPEAVMPDPTPVQPTATPAAPTPAPVPSAPVAQAATMDELLAIAQQGNLPVSWVTDPARRGQTTAEARAAAWDAHVAAQANAIRPGAQILRDEQETHAARLSTAFSASVLNPGGEPPPEAREYAGLTFHGLMRELSAAAGVRNVHRMSASDLADRFLASGGEHTTGDFPGVLANSMNKVVRDLYGAIPQSWSPFCDVAEYDDFKTITAANVGAVPEAIEVPEGGEFTYGTIGEETETYAIKQRGRLLAISRQMLINDDTRALQRAVQSLANGAYMALRRAVFAVLTDNGNMADGTALFHANHANLGSAAALSATTYGALRALLNKQTGPARTGATPAAQPLPPASQFAFIFGATREQVALELLGNRIVPTATGAVLPDLYRTSTIGVMDPMLDTGNNPYYLARTDMKPIEIAYLRGRRVPTVTSAEEINHTGLKFRTLFDFGVKAVTWRTIAANLGA